MLKMLEKLYLHLLILCGIICGFIAALSDEDTRASSDLLVRKKRVLSHAGSDLHPTRIEIINYMVNIKENRRSICAGVILTHHTVITAASCVPKDKSKYVIFSGGAYDYQSNTHNITVKALYYGKPPHIPLDGIALLDVDPPFEFSQKTGYLKLYEGNLQTGTLVTVSGWGCSYPPHRISGLRRGLRTIALPIMNHAECQNIYHYRFKITDKHLCTYDALKHCARTDAGAPLVVQSVDKLAGIHIYKGEFPDQKNPDVFINLQHPDFNAWIRNNTHLI